MCNKKSFYGATERGRVKNTQNQVKKHGNDLSSKELNLISSILLNNLSSSYIFNTLGFSSHLLRKDITFSFDMIEESLVELSDKLNNEHHNHNKMSRKSVNKPHIIELNANYDDRGNVSDVRILVRCEKICRVKMLDRNTGRNQLHNANLCFVYSLNSHRIVTAYWNISDDNHSTINMHRYSTMDFSKYLSALTKIH